MTWVKIFDKSRNLYGLNVARRSRKSYFLVCEGYMDVISMHQAGFTNAVASLGTAFTSQHGILIKRYVHEVILTYDSDALFAQLEVGKRNPGEILNHFINDEEQYREVAAIFNTKLKVGMTKEEKKSCLCKLFCV